MSNSLLQEGLQDICHFRNIILNSNEKIEHKLYRLQRTNPIQLASYCDFNEEHQIQDPYIYCEDEPRTTDYFTEMDSFSINKHVHNLKDKKDDFIQHYLKEYESIKQGLQHPPLRQRGDYTNIPHKMTASGRSKIKHIPLESEVSIFQKIDLPFKQIKRSKSINKQNISSVTLFPQDFFYDEDNTKNRNGYQSARCFEPQRSQRSQKEMGLSNRRDIRPQSQRKLISQRKLMNNSSKSNSLVGSQRKKSRRKSSNLNKTLNLNQIKYTNSNSNSNSQKPSKINFKKSIQVQKKPKSRQEKDREQICQRIKKRMYLSSAVYKSTDDNFWAMYQKELRERAEIVDKVMNHEKVLKKYKNSNYHIQPK